MSDPTEPRNIGAADPKAVLADYLARCQETVALCLQRAKDHEDPEQALVAARLIRTSIDLVAALEGRKLDFTYRFVDGRNPPTAGAKGDPSPHPRISANHT